MKLDKIRFARLIALIAERYSNFGRLDTQGIELIDELIDFEAPQVKTTAYADPAHVDELLKQMALTNKISAIKAYRTLTGEGLLEAKNAIERHYNRPADKAGMLAKLDQQMNTPDCDARYLLAGFDRGQLAQVKSFINSFV